MFMQTHSTLSLSLPYCYLSHTLTYTLNHELANYTKDTKKREKTYHFDEFLDGDETCTILEYFGLEHGTLRCYMAIQTKVSSVEG